MIKRKKEFSYKKNNEISRRGKIKEVRLVGENLNYIYNLNDALEIADGKNLDLVEINPNSIPPVCKLLDYNKFIYDKKKEKEKENKKNKQNKQNLKELRFTPHTEEHDFDFKKNHAENFLKNNDKVKAYVFFRGRELSFKEQGEIILLKLADELNHISIVESFPKMENNKMIMVLKPKK